ncbi:MAG: thioesterase family protein [Simkaniaceae bacterium]|nr:thioesterase family protein [Candidatus Sacchlamyda saccharinae]
MFEYRRLIFLSDTDATGALYFPEQLKMVGEAFESFLLSKKFSLKDCLLPVVHVEGDYHLPLHFGDELRIELSLGKIGTSSFTLQAQILKEGNLAGNGVLTHVAVDPKTSSSKPIPEAVLTVLRQL